MRIVTVVFLSFLFLSKAFANSEREEITNRVKAQFVYNFINFVVWPDNAFMNKQTDLKFCVFGSLSFAGHLEVFDGATITGRTLNVISSKDMADIKTGCHILFVGDDERVHLPKFWSQIEYMYVLSVGSNEGFTDQGGIINIFRTSDRVQFDVNINNALTNGLFLDSDLLALARKIKRHTSPPPD